MKLAKSKKSEEGSGMIGKTLVELIIIIALILFAIVIFFPLIYHKIIEIGKAVFK